MVPLWTYLSNSILYSLHEYHIKTLLIKTQHFFSTASRTNRSHLVQYFHYEKVIYIMKQLMMRPGNYLHKYRNWEGGIQFINKCKIKGVTIIHINQPTQYYINNTMGIIWIYKHFNLNKCLGFPNGTLKSIVLRSSLFFYKPIINLGRFDWT